MLASAVTLRNENILVFIMLLARRPLDANPGCKASGESLGIIHRGKFTFPHGIFPGFQGPEAL